MVKTFLRLGFKQDLIENVTKEDTEKPSELVYKLLTGTAVMQVGWSTLASPLVPFLILVEVSIIVVGVE